jgi:transglutaminase-like putative cysteine protease
VTGVAAATALLIVAAAAPADRWEQALRGAPEPHRAALAFLLEHMPEADRTALDPAFLLEEIALAYAARDAVPWGRDLPEDVFLNDVLPYANISERRDPWRAMLKERFLPLAQDCASPGEAAHRLNQEVFPALGVRYSTERARADQSPAESIESGKASCTGLSILLVDACRAVAVPARLAGIPNWVDDRGNHTWVEIWDGGAWHFAGAAEPDPRGLDHAWFTEDAALARADDPEHAIYAVSYRRTGLDFPMRFDPSAPPVPAVNVTSRYARPGTGSDRETRDP